jgi:predicted permease
MDIFIALVTKLLPLYAIMACGYMLARKHPSSGIGQVISVIQINLIAPLVIGSSVATLDMRGIYLILPVIFAIVCAVMAFLMFYAGRLWSDNTRNLIAYTGSSANTGYFGIPVALLLFPEHTLGLFMLIMLGFQIHENTLGYYMIARGHYTVRDSIMRLLRLPTLYGCMIGIGLSLADVKLPDLILSVARDFRSTYIVLGALLIGVGLAQAALRKPDGKFLGILLGAKFVLWPLLVYAIIAVDTYALHLFEPMVHRMMFLLAIVPLPANAVAFAMLLNVQPQKAATAVFISTIIALFYIPAILILLGYV